MQRSSKSGAVRACLKTLLDEGPPGLMVKREGWEGPESTPNGRVRQGRLALFDWNQLPGAALGWDIALKSAGPSSCP